MYSAQQAAWTLGFSALMLLPVLIGCTLLVGAFLNSKVAQKQTSTRIVPGIFGIIFLSAGVLGLSESVSQTLDCTSRQSTAAARTVTGMVGPVEALGNFGSQYYRFKVGPEALSSGAPGVKSECGLKASLAQSMYPPVGKQVRVRAIGSTIIELQIVE